MLDICDREGRDACQHRLCCTNPLSVSAFLQGRGLRKSALDGDEGRRWGRREKGRIRGEGNSADMSFQHIHESSPPIAFSFFPFSLLLHPPLFSCLLLISKISLLVHWFHLFSPPSLPSLLLPPPLAAESLQLNHVSALSLCHCFSSFFFVLPPRGNALLRRYS